jgi:hypothetical protein
MSWKVIGLAQKLSSRKSLVVAKTFGGIRQSA